MVVKTIGFSMCQCTPSASSAPARAGRRTTARSLRVLFWSSAYVVRSTSRFGPVFPPRDDTWWQLRHVFSLNGILACSIGGIGIG